LCLINLYVLIYKEDLTMYRGIALSSSLISDTKKKLFDILKNKKTKAKIDKDQSCMNVNLCMIIIFYYVRKQIRAYGECLGSQRRRRT
jgi:hypothetical protein